MRKRFRVLILAAIVAAVVVRVGFALSLQSGSLQTPSVSSGAASTSIVASTPASAPLLLTGSRYMQVPQPPTVPDGATLLGLGTLLLGLAAAVRRAV
jgi:hypothetical protein